MHVFVTGGAGFIGSHTCERLLRRGDRVTAIDCFDYGYDPALKEQNAELLSRFEGFRLVRGDIRDAELLDRVFAEDPPDVVAHLAARAGVRPSLLDPRSYVSINIDGTVTLLEAMRKHGIERHVFASSSSVYGSRTDGPFKETDSVDIPASPYAATKKSGEVMCANWHYLYGIQSTCLRFFTVYGPRQRPEMAIHLFSRKILDGEEITMFGDGSSVRDYTYIDDIVTGVVAAVDKPLGYVILNIGNGSPVRLDRLIRAIGLAVGGEPIVKQLPDQPGDVPMTYADTSRVQELLDYAPATSIEDGIAKFVDWLRTQD